MAQTYNFTFRGGDEALDFCNTWSRDSTERLLDYGRLVLWADQRGIVTSAEARRLLAEAERQPELARAVHRDALALRDALFRMFSARAADAPLAADDLKVLNAWLPRALARLRLSPDGGAWQWATDEAGAAGLERMLFPVVRAAAELLTHPERIGRVHQCASDDCGWLFVDTSKNRSRRWCNMADCGNRAKVRRHYARKRAADA